MMIRSPLFLAAAALTLTLAGCTSPIKPLQSSSSSPKSNSGQSAIAQIEHILQRAENAAPIESAKLKASAATQLIEMGRKDDAYRLLRQINTRQLPPSIAFEIARLQAEDALIQANPEHALSLLTPPTGIELAPEQQIAVSELRIQAYNQQQAPALEARELIYQSQFANEQPSLNQDRIWQALSRVPAEQLDLLISQDNNYQEQGWFELAQSVNNSTDLSQRQESLARWGILWENHPAKQTPPSAITGLNLSTGTISHLGLLLPQSGKLEKPAKAITEGLLSAYYQAENAPKLSFIDSTTIRSAEQLAQIVQERGIDFVIGPLDKNKVEMLTSNLSYRTPMMALNYSSNTVSNGSFQFGLSAADEAKQVAERMLNDGHKRAAILNAPYGWGSRAAQAFKQHFEHNGGRVVTQKSYKKQPESYNDTASELLATDHSKKRAALIKSITKRKLETQDRRRQDIDAIFLAAQPAPSRQLKPILAFHYASGLPIYATSHIYSGTPNEINDQDLSGVRFLGMPWNLKQNPSNKRQLANLGRNTNSRFGQLYALGIDAFRVYPLLNQLSSQTGSSISGLTGTLSIETDGNIKRSLLWGQFEEGLPVLAAQQQ